MTRLKQALIPTLIFTIVTVTHAMGVATSFDSVWSIPIARSVLYEQNVDLNEYPDLLKKHPSYTVESIEGRAYSIFPIGAPLLAVPVVALFDAAGIRPHDTKIEQLAASLVVALTAVLLYSVARASLDIPRALLITFIFAFCTAAWSTASRALWQHGPSMLMLTAALALILKARARPALIVWAGLPLAFSYVVRPTNAVSIALLSLFVLLRFRAYFLRYVLMALLVAIPFVVFSLTVYHAPLPHYYLPGRVGHTETLVEALVGNLVSPNRGLFVFSPVLLLSIPGAWLRLRHGGALLDWMLAAIVILHWLVISSFPHWWGGHSFGNRLFADMLPYVMYFMIPAVAALPGLPGPARPVRVGLAAALIVVSFFINYRGANKGRVYGWNARPVNVDQQPARIWDWRDLQALRGLHGP